MRKLGSFYSASSSIHLVLICTIFTVYLFSRVEGFDSLLQLSRSREYGNSSVTRKVFSVDDFGAKGDGVTDDTKAFKDAWKAACSSLLVSEIIIPAGNSYLVHPINFSGPCGVKMNLKISGAVIAPKDPDVWQNKNLRRWLYFHDVEHLTVHGHGIVNGMGEEWWARSCKINRTNPCQHAPTALTFHKCRYLKVRSLLMKNSQQMHLAFTNCVKVGISYLKVVAPATSPNTDGIHFSSSSHVELKNCIIKTGDDCIAIVGNSSEIKIKNVVCGPGHGISIGSLGKSHTQAHVHDIIVEGAHLSNTDNGVRIKTWQGGSGVVKKITFRNISLENVANPILIDQFYCDSFTPCNNQSSAVKIQDISYVGIKGTSASEEAIRFACSEVFSCEGLFLEDIQLSSSSSRGTVRSFCWEANGSTRGLIKPPPCFSTGESLLKERIILYGSLLQSSV